MATFSVFLKSFNKAYTRKSIRYGVPFLLLVLGGSFGLQQFAKLRYQFSNKQAVKPEDVEKYGIKMKEPGTVTLESEYEKIKKLDLDDWNQKRGPRPWENEETEKL